MHQCSPASCLISRETHFNKTIGVARAWTAWASYWKPALKYIVYRIWFLNGTFPGFGPLPGNFKNGGFDPALKNIARVQ